MIKPFILTLIVFFSLVFERAFYTFSLKEPRGQVLDKVIGELTIVSYLLVVLSGLIEFLINKNASYVNLFIGFIVVLVGIILRRISIKTLGKNWSIYVRDVSGQEYVNLGVYKYLKHPYYLAVSLELLGLIIIFYSKTALLLFLALHIPLLFIRISIENKLHRRKFINL